MHCLRVAALGLVFCAVGSRRASPPSRLTCSPSSIPSSARAATATPTPGATVPFGMVQVSPDTHSLRAGTGAPAITTATRSIMGFSLTHLSGTGIGDMLDVLLMPTAGPLQLEAGTREEPDPGYRSRFSHEQEKASPGYYSVRLADTGIGVELTATERVGLQRYTFPKSDDAHVVLDLDHRFEIDTPHSTILDAEIEIRGDDTIVGWRRITRWARTATSTSRRVSRSRSRPRALLVGRSRSSASARRGGSASRPGWTTGRAPARSSSSVSRSRRRASRGRCGTSTPRRRARTSTAPAGGGRGLAIAARRRSPSKAARRSSAAPSTPPSTTPSWPRPSSRTPTAPTAASTARSARPTASATTRRSPSGTRTAPRILSTAWCSATGPRTSRAPSCGWRSRARTGQMPVWPLANDETNCMIGYHSASVLAEALGRRASATSTSPPPSSA